MATKALKGKYIRIRMWNGKYKFSCGVTSLKSMINNMIIGVTQGFRYRMKLVFAHFPINAIISKDKTQVEIKNFLGGKKGHLINLHAGCNVELSNENQNELIFDGIDNQALSLCCSRVSQVCQIGEKDERKFLDGIFVSEKTVIQPLDE